MVWPLQNFKKFTDASILVDLTHFCLAISEDIRKVFLDPRSNKCPESASSMYEVFRFFPDYDPSYHAIVQDYKKLLPDPRSNKCPHLTLFWKKKKNFFFFPKKRVKWGHLFHLGSVIIFSTLPKSHDISADNPEKVEKLLHSLRNLIPCGLGD